MHSKDYKNASKWKGKHGVVIGTANTGVDNLYCYVPFLIHLLTMTLFDFVM